MRKMTVGGVGWTEATGGPVIVEFERRRYGTGASSRVYTWGYVIAPDGSRLLLGDPWPKITPGRAEVEEAAWAALIGWGIDRLSGAPYSIQVISHKELPT